MNTCDLTKNWGAGFLLDKWEKSAYGEASSIEEYAFFFGIASLLRPTSILEIGTSNGLASIAFLLGAKFTGNECKITTIDRYKFDFQKNMKLFGISEDSISFIQGDSREVLSQLVIEQKQYDLCFIDGGHDYETVLADWTYTQKLSKQWIFHDCISEPGVKRIIDAIQQDKRYQVFNLNYKPGHQVDDPTGEWYKTLTAPGICIVQKLESK